MACSLQLPLILLVLLATAPAFGQAIRYVAPTGSDTGQCTSQTSPCETISYAISVSSAHDTIEITDGEYTEPEGLFVDKSLAFHGESETGTIIQAHSDPGTAVSRVITLNGESEVEISNVTIRHGRIGSSGGNGGGILLDGGGSLELANVTIRDNIVATDPGAQEGEGGGMHVANGSIDLTNVTVSNNAAIDGGGLNIPAGGEPILRNVSFLDNQAANSGGGLYMEDTDAHLINVLFAGNHAGERGGALFSNGGTPRLATVTMSENTTEGVGGGIFSDGTTFEDWLYIDASIVWGNSADDDGNEFYVEEGGSIELHQVLMEWGPGDSGGEGEILCTLPDPGCLSSDPLFVDPDNGNFRLSEGSPAIDSAWLDPNSTDNFPIDPNGDPIDLDGNPRLFGNTIDRGSYEWQGTSNDESSPETSANVLSLPFPNPVHDSAVLSIIVDRGQHVTVEVVDMTGRRVAVLYHGPLAAGTPYKLALDASPLPAGVYVVRALGDDFAEDRRVTVVR